MQGNQIVKLTDAEIALSEAMSEHFESEDCNGVLYEQDFGGLSVVHRQFICKKCSRVFQI